jgi:hypothetical protein
MKKRVFFSAVTAAAMMLSCGSFTAFAAEADTATTGEETAETVSYSAETIIGEWEGMYTGYSGSTTIERSISLNVDQCDENGDFSGIATVTSEDYERYYFSGTFDFKTGDFKLKGKKWILDSGSWSLNEFKGSYDVDNSITGIVGGNNDRPFALKKTSDKAVDYSVDISEISRNWYGEYDGHSSDKTVVRRNIKVAITDLSESGDIKGTVIISPSDKAEAQYALDGSYYFSGTIDEKSGKIYYKGTEFIEKPDPNFEFIPFNGILTNGVIDGYTKNGIWKMESTDVLKGDLNFDNLLTVADLVALQKYLLTENDFNKSLFYYADMNDDEKVNAFDLILLRQAVAKRP